MTRARDLADSADKDIAGTLTLDGLTVAGNVSADGGSIKLDGNYPTGTGNVALGNTALDSLGAGNYNTAVGHNALTANTDGSNTAFGAFSLAAVTTGGNNVAVGREALEANTGDNNTSVGYQSLTSNTTASYNTAVGYRSLYSNTTGASNVAVGIFSLEDNTTGNYNVAFGGETLRNLTTGSFNTAVGDGSQGNTTTASNNTSVGGGSLLTNTTGNYNVAIGKDALRLNTTANNSTAVGYQAGYNSVNADSTFIGTFAGYAASYAGTGRNTFIGFNAGGAVTSGRYNTILGSYNGNSGGLDIRTSSNNIVLSDGDGNPRLNFNSTGRMFLNCSATSGLFGATSFRISPIQSDGMNVYPLGQNFSAYTVQADNTTGTRYAMYIANSGGNGVGTISFTSTSTAYNTSSDHRLKENVVELTGATDRLKQIPVHRFNFIADADTTVDGFLAHEVQAVVPEAITGTHNEVDDEGNPVYQGIDQSKLVPLLVATIKELEARITALENA